MDTTWCTTCGTRHPERGPCPGAVLATGSERAGWRVTVDTPGGPETIGILVAAAGAVWRARIVTFPSTLWTVPGSETSLKFVALSPQEAEAEAAAFVEERCAFRGWARRETIAPFRVGTVAPERAPGVPPAESPARRRLRAFPVRFGPVAPTIDAVTANVSETGLFIATLRSLEPGRAIRMRLDLDEARVTLRGHVVWSQERAEVGRPAGMGVRLVDPPGVYAGVVRALP